MAILREWESFYIIVGSAAGALIGLQFVFISLLAERSSKTSASAGTAFATPTIVHFCFVLFASAILSAPWKGTTGLAAVLWLLTLPALLYTLITLRRMRRQDVYQPVLEDWLFHVVIPATAYLLAAVAACTMPYSLDHALDFLGVAHCLLLLCGIHNAWDAVTYYVLVQRDEK